MNYRYLDLRNCWDVFRDYLIHLHNLKSLQASNENTEEVQTFLSDMFGELTPPDRPKKTLRRCSVKLSKLM